MLYAEPGDIEQVVIAVDQGPAIRLGRIQLDILQASEMRHVTITPLPSPTSSWANP